MSAGHRDRVRTRANEQAPDSIPEYEVLEMIIHGVVKQKDSNSIARELIKEFGSLSRVIDAPARELCQIKGVGPVAADFIKKIPYFYFKYKQSKWEDHRIFDNTDDIIEFLQDRFIGSENESVVVMCMNSKCKLIACRTLFEGNINSVDIHVGRIVDFAIASKAARIVIAHNHPNNDIEPSTEDQNVTRAIYNALSFVGILLDDHIIVTANNAISLARTGFFPQKTADEEE